jgi:hypothetical protein
LLAFFGAGYLTGVRVDRARTPAHSEPEPVDHGIEPVATIDAPQSDEKPTAPVAAEGSIGLLAALRDQHPDAVKISVLTRRDQIDESFAALLGLRDQESMELNRLLGAARSSLNALATANAKMVVGDDGVITINVTPFEGGAEIYDRLMDGFAATLGSERADAFKHLFGDEFVRSFQNFGAEQRKLTIAETLPRFVDWNDGMYYIKDERRTEQGPLELIAFRFRADRMEFLPPHLQWIAPLITGRLPPLLNRTRDEADAIGITH